MFLMFRQPLVPASGGPPPVSGTLSFTNFATPHDMNGSTVAANMTGVTVNASGLFVAVGFNASNQPLFATSSDGVTWTTPALMNGSTAVANMQSVTVNSSGLFVAVGYMNDGSNSPVSAHSSNGSTWTTPALMNGSTVAASMTSIAVNSTGRFVATGFTPAGLSLFATSTAGSMNCVTVNSSDLFVSVGYNGSTNVPLFSTSSNGTTWTAPAAMNGSAVFAQMFAVTVN